VTSLAIPRIATGATKDLPVLDGAFNSKIQFGSTELDDLDPAGSLYSFVACLKAQ
jgi:hypothetical protein